jgi:hypothetical protein
MVMTNLAISTVATAPSPAGSGTSLTVAAGHGARFPQPSTDGAFSATVWPSDANPDPTNAEIVLVTARSGDVLTIARTQEGSSARSVVVGDRIMLAVTAGMWGNASGVNATSLGRSSAATGDNSVAVGSSSTALGYATVVGASASGSGWGATALGYSASASATSAVALGYYCSSSGTNATALGYNAAASREGQHAVANGCFAVGGDSQASQYVLRIVTTDATATEVTTSGSTSGYVDIPASRTYACMIKVVAIRTDVSGTAAAWTNIQAAITRDSTGNCRLLGSVVGGGTTTLCDAGASTWTVAVTADTSNQRLAITVTGEAGKTIRWVATVDLVEVGA